MKSIFEKLFELMGEHPNDYEFGREVRKFLNDIAKQENQNKSKDGGK